MIGKPAALTAATGMDALTHAVEAYILQRRQPGDGRRRHAGDPPIACNLRQAVALGSNLQARENMAYALCWPGWLRPTPTSATHAMAHQLGGLYDMPHGVANAVLLPHAWRATT